MSTPDSASHAAPPCPVTGLLHAGLLVSDLAAARHFYEAVVGLVAMPRPADMPYPGAWYDLGGGQQIHLMGLPNPDAQSVRPEHGGRDRHIAFGITDMATLRVRFDAAGVAYSVSKSGRAALFCRDPDGNTLEFVGR
jgi:catechol 2,3-dioxygenase-like lactoylglutathione lyase family enzyme